MVEMLVVLAIILILLSLLQPALQHSLALAHDVVCKNNLRQVSLAIHTYVEDWDGIYPRGASEWEVRWAHKDQPLPGYLGLAEMPDDDFYRTDGHTNLNCPASPFDFNEPSPHHDGDWYDYAVNKHLMCTPWMSRESTRVNELEHPATIFLATDRNKAEPGDGSGYWGIFGWDEYTSSLNWRFKTYRHMGMVNLLWADGSAQSAFIDSLARENFGPEFNYVPWR